jgi:hypothetical protein
MGNSHCIVNSNLVFNQRFYPFALASAVLLCSYKASAMKRYLSSVGKRCKCRNPVNYLLKYQQFKPRLSVENFTTQFPL